MRTNILILGKSGVGKSSLLNYLFGEVVAKSGAGKPITGKGIYPYKPFSYNKIQVAIYDSWGLEANKTNEWKEYIELELAKNNAKDIKEWFHTVIYCVDVKRTRLDDFEIHQIIKPLLDSGNNLIFALTRSDIANDNEIMGISNALTREFSDCLQVRICSVSQISRSGKKSEPFGKSEIMDKICINLHANLVNKTLSNFVRVELLNNFDNARKKSFDYLENKKGFWRIFNIYNDEFRSDLARNAENQYRYAYETMLAKLRDKIEFINKYTADVSDSLGNYVSSTVVLKTFPHIDKAGFGAWDNSVGDYIASLLFSRQDRIEMAFSSYLDEMTRTLRSHFQRIITDIRLKEREVNILWERQMMAKIRT